MALINLKALGVTLGARLFSNLDLSVEAGDRIGIVAANGRGKSTLLRTIAGTFEPTDGDVTKARGLTIGHVEQDIAPALLALPFHEAVRQALPSEQAESESWRADVVLEAFEVPEELRGRALGALSGGWQRLALLARVWVNDPDALLLDEPTNHLDLARIRWLEDWLTSLPQSIPLIVASHDRAFLDAVTNRTLFLRAEQSHVFALPYSRARVALDEIDASQERQYQRDIKAAQQLRRRAAKLNNIGINSGSDLLVIKTKQLKSRAERLEDAARPAHQERSAGAIRLANRGTHARQLVTLDDAEVRTPDGTLLFKTGRRWICQGDRIVLLGRNGSGKSRLVGMLRDAIAGVDGGQSSIRATPSLVLGHVDQALADLGNSDTPIAAIGRRFEFGDQRLRSLLAGAGIGIDMQERPIGRLSGGQKARLAMLVLRLTNPNFYLLDEPTNHLDIEGQETLENELMSQEASCLVVSHDRSFVRTTGNRFWQIEGRKLFEVEGPEVFFTSVSEDEN